MLRQWIIGILLGTIAIAISSPLFVRSYVQRETNRAAYETAGVQTLPAGSKFRWRSEGYATTSIGPHGLVGKTELRQDVEVSIALWGDSQAEGVTVSDHQKIFAVAKARSKLGSGPDLQVFPLAQSGDDASDWVHQFGWADKTLAVDAHVLLIVELSDLAAATKPYEAAKPPRFASTAAYAPAFVIQSVRNLIMEPDGQTLRSLRFAVGPVQRRAAAVGDLQVEQNGVDWTPILGRLIAATDRPVFVIYAPKVPAIAGGKIRTTDPDHNQFQNLRKASSRRSVTVIDLTDALVESAKSGRYPHGFHNGRFGSGHLNQVGNEIVANEIVRIATELRAETRSARTLRQQD